MKKLKITKHTMKKNARKVLSLIRSKPYLDTYTDEELVVELETCAISNFTNHKISVSFEVESDHVPRVWNDEQQKEINDIRATLATHGQILDTHTTQIGLILTTLQEVQKQQLEMQKQQQEMQRQIIDIRVEMKEMEKRLSDKIDNLAEKLDKHINNHN